MERLTYWCDDGMGGGEYRVNENGTEYSGHSIDRLAAYEDTGLEPEEVDQIRRAAQTMMFPTVADFVRYAIQNFEDLQKYRKAESEGRLLVLPCKVGDTLWTFANYPDCYIYPFKVKDIILTGEEIRTDCVGTIRWSDIGNTVFRTREASEAALKECEGT